MNAGCHPERSEAESKDPANLTTDLATGFRQLSHEATTWQATSLGMTVLSIECFALFPYPSAEDVDRRDS